MNFRLLLIALTLSLFFKQSWSQCLEISSVFVNACTIGSGSTNCTQEGPNEMFTFTVGASDLFVGNISGLFGLGSMIQALQPQTRRCETSGALGAVTQGQGSEPDDH